jgi:hypothetical protein
MIEPDKEGNGIHTLLQLHSLFQAERSFDIELNLDFEKVNLAEVGV